MKRDILNLSFLIPNLLLWLKISIFRCLLYSFKAGYKNTKQTKAKILNGNLRFFPQLFSLSQLMAKYIFGLWLFLLNISKIGSLFQIQPLLGKKKPKQQQQKKVLRLANANKLDRILGQQAQIKIIPRQITMYGHLLQLIITSLFQFLQLYHLLFCLSLWLCLFKNSITVVLMSFRGD